MTPLTVMRQHKRAIMLLFAISVLSVIACDLICAAHIDCIERFKITSYLTSRPVTHNHFSHSRNTHQNFQPEINHLHTFQTSGETPAQCCKNLSTQFHQSLFKNGDTPEIKSVSLSSVHFVRFEGKYLSENFARYLNFHTVSCILELPPIAGGRLRVLINSFLI